ncbi:MAG: ATP-binding protein [Parasulfuritortus sp.]|jgi:signal transduction histidine kinase|nr:ATP-binding protein [Parasulfuritortus sp.]
MAILSRARRDVTIRTAILRGSLALVLVAIVLSGSLSFIEFRRAFKAEIAQNLGNSSSGLLERIDVFFFERLEDLREWRRVELMQDIQVGDVDKRLARLLGDLKAGHGDVYSALYCTNAQGRIVAASDPGLVGIGRQPGAPMKAADQVNADGVVLEQTTAQAPEGAGHYVLRTTVPNALGLGNIGYLYAVLNWNVVRRFLTDDIRDSERTAQLLDTAGQVIATSGDPSRAGVVDKDETLLTGSAVSPGYQHFSGFGWRMRVVEPTRVAFAPVWHLAWVIMGGLLFSLAVAGWLSSRLAKRLASPIGRLTEFARNFRRGNAKRPPVLHTGISEVGELSHAFAEMIDALEESREHLVRAGKLAVVGEMAAIMAHEVRTPLGILKSSAQMLERRGDLTEQDRELTGFIVSETERLNRLVTTLLECASPRPPLFQPHDVHEIIEHVLALIGNRAEKKNIRIETRLNARQSILACDREQMIQVFLNLIINATQHVPDGGWIRIVSFDDGKGFAVRVEDDGPGIPSGVLDRVFDPFFTRREGGIGLGLTIVQQIVQAHEGEIEVAKSALGGAAFTVRFGGSKGEAK